jgi:hypothetical protein
MERNSRGPIQGTIPYLGDTENFVKTSVKIFGDPAEIRTENPREYKIEVPTTCSVCSVLEPYKYHVTQCCTFLYIAACGSLFRI